MAPDQEDRRVTGGSVSWKAYVDVISEEHRAQVAAALSAHDIRVSANKDSMEHRLGELHESTIRLIEAGDEALKQHINTHQFSFNLCALSIDVLFESFVTCFYKTNC